MNSGEQQHFLTQGPQETQEIRPSANKQLGDYLHSLPRFEQVYLLNRIALACDCTYQAVYKWVQGKGKIRTPFIQLINETIGQEIIKF